MTDSFQNLAQSNPALAACVEDVFRSFTEQWPEEAEIKAKMAAFLLDKLPGGLLKQSQIHESDVESLRGEIEFLTHRYLKEFVAARAKDPESSPEPVKRFDRFFRIQHMMLMAGVLILIFTGLPLKFSVISGVWVLKLSRVFHRIGAILLFAVAFLHVYYILVTKPGRKMLFQLLPMPSDVRDVFLDLGYFIGKKPTLPAFSNFSFREKFDYWAVYWGMVIMLGTGSILWWHKPIAMGFLAKWGYEFLSMATVLHSDEALLATLAIFIWHFYRTHLNPHHFPINWTFWTGEMAFDLYFIEHRRELLSMRDAGQLTERQCRRLGDLLRLDELECRITPRLARNKSN